MNNQVPKVAPLCDVCQKIDLWKTNNNREVAEYDLGTWEDVKRKAEKRPRCPFCVTLRLLAKTTYTYESGKASITWREEGGFYSSTYGDTLAFLNEETAKSPYGSARAVQSYIDPPLMKKWLNLCETHHGETCKPTASIIRTSEGDPGVKVLRVIDVEDWCIVEAKPKVRYLALSYVWGPVVQSLPLKKDNLAELSTQRALLDLRPRLPKTISHAIDLVRLIGERYLWVDSLCLIQDDEDDVLDGISHMDLVYQCAVLTIIAAHGGNADAGLPGLHPGTRNVEQNIIEVLPGVKMTHTGVLYDAMNGSYYNDRGWTLQELVLSHRALIFTKDRIYFRCRANCWSEDAIYDNFPTAINAVLHSGTVIYVLADNEPEPLPAYYCQLLRYTPRKLTNESDRIHGFTGILRFLSVNMRSGLLEGLFTASFDISLIFWQDWSGEIDIQGRQEGFPSWSWAGWRNITCGYGTACNSAEDASGAWLQQMTYIVWYKRRPDAAALELVWDLDAQLEHGKPETHHIGYRPTLRDPYGRTADEALANLRTRPDDDADVDARRAGIIHEEITKRKYTFLHFFAHVVSVPRFGYRGTNPILKKILGPGGMVCGWIQFHDPALMQGIQGPHDLVLLSEMGPREVACLANMRKSDQFFNGTVTFDRPFYWVMLIVWLGEERVVAERRGLGFVFQECMRYLPGKVWTEIALA